MKIIKLTSQDYKIYNEFLKTNKNAMFYYTLEYKEILERFLKASSEYFVAKENDTIQGVLPLFKTLSSSGYVINSLPFYGSHGGVLANNTRVKNELFDKFLEISQAKDTAICMFVENLFERLTPQKYDYKDTRIGQTTDLSVELLENFHSKTRNAIKKAQKLEVKIAVENDAFEFLFETHKENMQAMNANEKEKEFFKTIQDLLSPNLHYKIYTARLDKELISACLLFYFKTTVEYFTPVIKEEFRSTQALSLLIFTAMKEAKEKGFTLWNWGGTWQSQDGVYRFKNRFNAKDTIYNYYGFKNKDVSPKEVRYFYLYPFGEK